MSCRPTVLVFFFFFLDRFVKWRCGWFFQTCGVFFRQICEVAVWQGVSDMGCVF